MTVTCADGSCPPQYKRWINRTKIHVSESEMNFQHIESNTSLPFRPRDPDIFHADTRVDEKIRCDEHRNGINFDLIFRL